MALHDDLLGLARLLVTPAPAAPVEAYLRRAVSTAYYALFHLLVNEATTRLIAIPGVQGRVARAFEHGVMKTVCKDYAVMGTTPLGHPVSGEIRTVAEAFGMLQEARHRADYNLGLPLTHAAADIEVTRAEGAFLDWAKTSAAPAATEFLTELLCRSIRNR